MHAAAGGGCARLEGLPAHLAAALGEIGYEDRQIVGLLARVGNQLVGQHLQWRGSGALLLLGSHGDAIGIAKALDGPKGGRGGGAPCGYLGGWVHWYYTCKGSQNASPAPPHTQNRNGIAFDAFTGTEGGRSRPQGGAWPPDDKC